MSDHICIFCGNSPHVNPEECRSRAVHGPATTAIISHMRLGGEGGMGDMTRSALAESVRAARECERNGDYAEALIRWKSLLHDQGENPRLSKHIRNLEALAHDQAVERLIARGHALRERRAFLRAISCYRSAIRGMANDDPRASRLHKVVTATRKHARLTAVIYSAAGLILLVVAYLVAEPWLELNRYRDAIAEARAVVQQAPTKADPVEAFEHIHGLISSEQLQPSTVELKSRAELAYRDLLQLYNTSVGELARKEARAIRRAHQQQRWREVVERKTRFDEVFAIHAPQPELGELGEEAASKFEVELARSERLKQDPQRLTQAQEFIAQGDYPAALPILESLSESPDTATASAARSARAQLEQQAGALEERFAEVEASIGQDLEAAAARLARLREAAVGWRRDADLDALAQRIATERRAAQQAWRTLGERPGAVQLREFLTEHAASPEAQSARARLAELEKARDQQLSALTRYQTAVDRQDPAAAFEAARAYLLRYPDRAAADAIKLPLQLDAGMPDVALMADNETVATTDAQGTALWWYAPDRTARLTASKPGFEPVTTTLARLRNEWRWTVEPVRAPIWQMSIEGQIEAMTGLSGGPLVVVDAREVIAIDQGRELWRRSLGDGMMLTSGLDSRADPVVGLDDARLLLPLKQGGVRILDRQTGRVLASQEFEDPVRGMPVLYTSALRQGEQRIACIADGLRFGRLGQELRVAEMRSNAQSGPVVLRGDLEVLLVVATNSGLSAVEDSTGSVRWSFDLDATNVGPLIRLDEAHLLTVLDGSRLVCCRIDAQGATRSWQQVLNGESLIGHPQLAAGRIHLTTDRRLLVYDATGARDPQRSI
ncbi:MAG: PQQ-binding-like beta-propeller repeat protein, partial [Planctomycetota bacterium]